MAAAMATGLVSLVSVVTSVYPLIPILLAYVLLGERVSALQPRGTLAALAGVAMITAG